MFFLLKASYFYKIHGGFLSFVKKYSRRLTFCLNNVGHVESVVHPQYEDSILKVKSITVRKEKK